MIIAALTFSSLLVLFFLIGYWRWRNKARDQLYMIQQPFYQLSMRASSRTALWMLSPIVLTMGVWVFLEVSYKVMVGVSFLGVIVACLALCSLGNARKTRTILELLIKAGLFSGAALAILTTFAIAFLMISEALRFFQLISFTDFLFGLKWNPSAVTQDAPLGYFGILPLLAGTFVITLIAMGVALPAGLLSAIYLSHYASDKSRAVLKPLLEILAGIPTIVYGFFAVIAVSPWLHNLGVWLGLSIASESALGVGMVMGIMIIPYIASLSDDVLVAVPIAMRDGSLALGATPSESIKKVILPAALPGISASILLAFSRAIGETMIVVMAAGYSAKLTINPFEAVTTVTVQIVNLLSGDQEANSPQMLSAFALGLVLFLITLVLNIFAIKIVRYYREKYD